MASTLPGACYIPELSHRSR